MFLASFVLCKVFCRRLDVLRTGVVLALQPSYGVYVGLDALHAVEVLGGLVAGRIVSRHLELV